MERPDRESRGPSGSQLEPGVRSPPSGFDRGRQQELGPSGAVRSLYRVTVPVRGPLVVAADSAVGNDPRARRAHSHTLAAKGKASPGGKLLMKEDAPRGLHLVAPLIAALGDRLNVPEGVQQRRAFTGGCYDQHLVAVLQDVIGRIAHDFEGAVHIADRPQLGELSGQVVILGHE